MCVSSHLCTPKASNPFRKTKDLKRNTNRRGRPLDCLGDTGIELWSFLKRPKSFLAATVRPSKHSEVSEEDSQIVRPASNLPTSDSRDRKNSVASPKSATSSPQWC